MPDSAAIDRGREFEREVGDALGLKLVPGSGNQWSSKSDVAGALRVSCKATKKRTWGQTRFQLSEAIELAIGTGETPALALLDDDDQAFVVMRLADAAAVLTEEARIERVPRRSSVIRDAAMTPTLLRDE